VATIEATYEQNLQQADALSDWQRRDEARKAASSWRGKQLAQVDAFVEAITKKINAREASAEFVELTRILQEKGVDDALKYIGLQEQRLLSEAENQIAAKQQEVHMTLAPLLEKVRLLATQGNFAAASAACDKLLALDRDWDEALHEKFLARSALGNHAILYG